MLFETSVYSIHSPDADLRQKVLLIHDRLCATYQCPIEYFSDRDPLSELISALLSHRTKNADSHRAFQQLVQRYPNWEAVLNAPTEAVEQAIAPCTWAEQKAPRIQQILALIAAQCSDWSLDFLADMPVAAARDWLEALPGVGPKTSAAVLAFSRLRRRALPVDSHHHRVAVRLGLIGDRVAVAPAHPILEALLPEDWTAQQVYDHHEIMMLHGQRCCYYRNPACDRCPVLEYCPEGLKRKQGNGQIGNGAS